MITVKTFGNYKRQNFEPELMTGCDHDQNVYHYRLVAGDMVLRGIVLGHGWEHRPMSWTTLSCYKRKEDDRMAKRQAPPYEELRQIFIDAEYKIDRVRKVLKVNWSDAKQWLKDAGLIDSYNRPTEKVTAEPVRSMGCIAPIGVEVPQYEPEDDDYLDGEPVVPQVVEKPFDANAFRLEVIENIIEMSGLRNAPKEITLELISGVLAN